jgi:chaperonin GroEL (HSP60 family)
MNKMVINHLEKLFVTSDASTIVTEMDVYHPAAKLLVMAAKAQAGEVGDGTNLVSKSIRHDAVMRISSWLDRPVHQEQHH